MKKFLQKAFALLALCLVSMGAMAEELSFSPRNGGTADMTDGVATITCSNSGALWDYGINIWARTTSYISVTCAAGYEIYQVDLTGLASSGYGSTSGFGSLLVEMNNKGSIVPVSNGATWTGSQTSLDFGTDDDFVVGTITVYYRSTGAVVTSFEFQSANPAAGTLTSAINGINFYCTGCGQLAWADGKSVTDITVNGVALPESTIVNLYKNQIYINYQESNDGTYTITIPEGVFVNESDLINEEISLTYVLNIPGFAVSAAEWTTFCYNHDWVMPDGYVGYIVSDIVDGHAILTDRFPAGYVVPTYLPILINGPETTKVPITFSGFYGATPDNYLRGNMDENPVIFTASSIWIYKDDEYCSALYKFCDGENGLGFYYDSVDGATLTCQPNKAFLAVPASKVPAGSNGLKIRFADEATGISAIATESNDAIYNLQGQRVNATAAGIYVKNGKKFIVK